MSHTEKIFAGHFPRNRLGAGVLTVGGKVGAYAAAIFAKEENRGKIAYFENSVCKFKGKIVPGDKVKLETKIVWQKGLVGVGEAVAA